MKYILLIVSVLFLCSCDYIEEVEDYNYLDDNSLRFIRTEEDTSILINKGDVYYLLLLGEDNSNIEEVDYLIKYKSVTTDISYNYEYLLEDDIVIDDLEFKKNDKIEIVFNDNNFCIYMKELDRDNYSECDFIYLYNIDNDFYITLNSDLLVIFYHAYTRFNYRFMHHLTTVWIDSYTIDTSSYTTLKIEEDDFEVSSDKIRGKTIHKK